MFVSEMRKVLYTIYPGLKWRQKVDKMSEQQVHAVYISFMHRRKITT